MKWFIRKNIFSHHKPATVICDLDPRTAEIPDEQIETDQGQIRCRRIKTLSAADIENFRNSFPRMDCMPMFDIPEIQRRLEKGYYLTVAEKESGSIVGWTWVAVGSLYFSEFNCTIALKPGHGFTYNTYVEKPFRGRKVNHRMKDVQLFHLKRDGYRKVWGLIHHWNEASIKSLKNMGWEQIGDYTFIKLFFMNLKFPPRGV